MIGKRVENEVIRAELNDQSQMEDIIREVMDSLVSHDAAYADMLNNPGWRFKFRKAPIRTKAYVGKVTANHMRGTVRAAYETAIGILNGQQSNAHWALMAWETTSTSTPVRERKPVTSAKEHHMVFGGKAYVLPQQAVDTTRTEEDTVLHEVVVINMAFVDLMKNSEVDNWLRKTGQTDSPVYGGKMTPRMKSDEAAARNLIERYAAFHGQPVQREVPPLLTRDEVEAVQQMIAKKVPSSAIETVFKKPWEQIKAYIESVSV